jgi:predicted O-linked N-acetylglucosamine transferase (SPINDLY family)
MGNPDVMEADFIQYIIADQDLIGSEVRELTSQNVVDLPHAFIASPLKASTSPWTRQQANLPEDAFVFCCLNLPTKIDPAVFKSWMRILNTVKNSVLWLFEANDYVIENLQKEATKQNIENNRLVFAEKLPFDDYVSRFSQADLFLDTFRYNAGATAIEALRMGVPLLTLPGKTYCSRMGACITRAAGMSELICKNAEDYEQRAIEIALSPEKHQALKEKLRNSIEQGVPLFDVPYFVKTMEDAFEKMWERHEQGLAPDHIYISQ